MSVALPWHKLLPRLPGPVEIALVLALAWVVAGVLVPRPPVEPTVAAPAPTRSETAAEDVRAVIDAQPFGPWQPKKAAPKVTKPKPKPVVSKLNAKLLGTVVAGEKSVAIIRPKPGAAVDVFHIGDNLLPGVRVQAIEAQRVVLDVHGRLEALWLLPHAKDPAGARPASPPPTERIQISRALIQQVMSDLPNLLRQVRVVPYFQNGKNTGYMVAEVDPNSVFARMGLQVRDVIRAINRRPLTRPEEVMAMYQQLQGASSVDVSILRNGREKVLHFEIQ